MKKILCFSVLIVLLLIAFSIPIFAEDNAQSGSGDAQGAITGYGWYNPYQYLWKVTLFVGKTDQVTKQSDLVNDFHRLGTVVMKKTGWTVSSSVKFGNGIKVDYYSGTAMSMDASPKIISDSNCPTIPIVCDGDVEMVKSYFGSTGTMTTLLNAIANDKGMSAETMINSLSFSIGGNTKTGWSYDYVAPNGTSNRVPWVIIYEPMVVLNLKDKVTQLAFTATEFALCEINGWYDWDNSNGTGQRVSLLTDYHLPTSVQLEESWFGYPVYAVTDGSRRWAYADTVKGGGWGMRWLPISVVEPVVDDTYDFSVSSIGVNPSSAYQGNSTTVTFISDNWNTEVAYDDILVEVLVDNTVVKSEYVDFVAYGRNRHSYTIPMTSLGTQNILARINWEDRYREENNVNNSTSIKATANKYYEFSVSDLQVSPTNCSENDIVTVTFRTDSWDRYNAYEDVPIELLYNGEVIYTEYVDYAVYGGKNHTLNLNVGKTVGVNDISARVNWLHHFSEVDTNNNETSITEIIVQPEVDLTIEAIAPNSDYRAGMTVVTGYHVYNNSAYDVVPNDNNTVYFEVYYYENGAKNVIDSQTWNQVVVPAYDNNLVYFKWTIPLSCVKKTLYCEATVNYEDTISESEISNNTSFLTRTVTENPYSQTADTRYEGTKPNGFTIPSVPSTGVDSATWSLWEYSDENFVKVNYGVTISSAVPSITPDEDCPSAEYKSDQWQMKSGYGIHLNYSPNITSISGCTMPSSSAYTGVQRVEAAFPEFKYAKTVGSFRSIEKSDDAWVFVRNTSTDLNERLHFTPLWYPNGNYIVSVTATDVWTPAGMISAVRNSNTIKIVDSAYDDWYVGEGG